MRQRRRITVLAVLPMLFAGCAGEAEVATPDAPSEPPGPEAPTRYVETEWLAAESHWIDKGAGGTSSGGSAINPGYKRVEPGRVLLFNVTPHFSRDMHFVVFRDDVQIARVPVNASGETRLELDASSASRFTYEFDADSVGAGRYKVAFATRHVLTSNATATR